MPTARSIVLVSCVKSKHAHKAKAKDLYDSTLFRAQRSFAEHFADQWFILSAKYGLLDPEAEIEPYEDTLKGGSVQRKRRWSAEVFAQLEKVTERIDKIIITAGEDYCRYLIPMIALRGNEVERPVKGLTMGFIPGRLYDLISSSKAPAAAKRSIDKPPQQPASRALAKHRLSSADSFRNVDKFYNLLDDLRRKNGGPYILKELSPASVPKRGIYLFFEDGELRSDGITPRVVRIGTHGLKNASKSTLYGRLTNHRGARSGAGNHRGSVFRLHVGKALIKRNALECPTWGKNSSAPREIVSREKQIEHQVSDYIGRMSVLLLDIPDKPGPESLRGFIERNAIGLLARQEAASKSWLGFDTDDVAIIAAHLWNVNHIDYKPDTDFLERLSVLIADQQ